MTARRSRGEGGLHWDESRQRWIATAALGYDARGKRITRKASGTTKTAAKAKLREMLRDHAEGLTVTSGLGAEPAVHVGLTGRKGCPRHPWLPHPRSRWSSDGPVRAGFLDQAGSGCNSTRVASLLCL